MLPLYAPPQSLVVVTPLGENLRTMRAAFLSQHAVERFLGSMASQRERVLPVKRGEVPRDEVSREIATLESWVRRLLDESGTPLPERADAWAIDAQRRHWGWA